MLERHPKISNKNPFPLQICYLKNGSSYSIKLEKRILAVYHWNKKLVKNFIWWLKKEGVDLFGCKLIKINLK
jgi:hypothetical protein